MSLEQFLSTVKSQPEHIEFADTIQMISDHYEYTPSRFTNGPTLVNEAGTNEGSCKIFAFAQLNNLNEKETLACFGAYYRDDVLKHPEGSDHGNIRNFMEYGWAGIHFDQPALLEKQAVKNR